MGLENGRLEMLFIAPDERGHGLGRQLLTLAIEKYNVTEHTVNEQKPLRFGILRAHGVQCLQEDRD